MTTEGYGYVVLTTSGMDLLWRADEQDAIEAAVERLDDDPELRQLEVCRIVFDGEALEFVADIVVADIVQGPGRNFEGEIVVLRKGETLANPFGNQSSMTEAEIHFDCAKCGDGDALRAEEECVYCGLPDESGSLAYDEDGNPTFNPTERGV